MLPGPVFRQPLQQYIVPGSKDYPKQALSSTPSEKKPINSLVKTDVFGL